MGGNATGKLKASGLETQAEKIPLKTIGRSEFMKVIKTFLLKLNKDFEKFSGKKIWQNENLIMNGFAFNGSTSFIMDPTLTDDEVIQYKQTAGDIDVIIPDVLKEDLWNYLDKVEDKFITDQVKYMGCNKPTISSIGEQINAVFLVDFDNGVRCACQIDFEFLEHENGLPTEWAKFSHSSSFEDAKAGVKAVHHKYLIRALVGGASVRDDIVIATAKSTPDKIKLSSSGKNELPRMLKFSVARGIRVAYEPMYDENGEIIKMNGKLVYKEIPTKDSTYVTVVKEIYKLSFGQDEINPADVKKFESFVGVLDLMKKYLNKKQIEATHERYLELLWGVKPQRAQELERDSSDADFNIKNSGYQKFISILKLKDESKKLVEEYYKNYGVRESFYNFLKANTKLLGIDDEF